jgi:hypothetical protein
LIEQLIRCGTDTVTPAVRGASVKFSACHHPTDLLRKQMIEQEMTYTEPTVSDPSLLEDSHLLKETNKRIHPIIVYPFAHPQNLDHLKTLYTKISELCGKTNGKYYTPITVLNRQTIDRVCTPKMNTDEATEAKARFEDFLATEIKPHSKIIEAWCVDTCQMWLTGLGSASDENSALAAVYWLIPGDFNYNSEEGRKVLRKIEEIPLRVYQESAVDLSLGEIKVPLNSAKQLIDTYGTYGLLYNWFPTEAQGIRLITDKPRTEFFAISDSYLRYVLSKRWYAYEQTIVLLLHAMAGLNPVRGIRKVELGEIQDEEQGRSRLEGAMQQVERTERVLKLFWRERHSEDRAWREQFRILDRQSEQVRGAAMVIFEQILA